MKTCTVCRCPKPLEEFVKNRTKSQGRDSRCLLCARSKWKMWYKNNRHKWCQKMEKWAREHPDKVKRSALRFHLRRAYGLSIPQVEALRTAQDGKCALCLEAVRLCVDHDHKTGRVRGLVCSRCNTGLGHIERVGWLPKAISYLTKK